MKKGHGFTEAEIKSNSQLVVTIPNDNDGAIVSGDYVEIKRVEPPMLKTKCRFCKNPYSKHTIEELYKHKLLGVR